MRLRNLLFRHSKKIHDYFTDAVRVYALRGEEDARCAAIVAAKVAGKKQRQSMVESLSKMAANVRRNSLDRMARKSIADRILLIKEEVNFKAWRGTGFPEEEELSKMNAEYLSCLNRADPTIFKRKYPKLF
jgi:hypothetical protein